MQEYSIHKAAGVIVRDKKILVERSLGKEFFIAPGGSIEDGETAKQALVRELKEEFQITTSEDDFTFFDTFYAVAAGKTDETRLRMDVFMVAHWDGEPTPDNEVEEIAWITSEIPETMKVGSIFEKDVIPRLKKEGIIN